MSSPAPLATWFAGPPSATGWVRRPCGLHGWGSPCPVWTPAVRRRPASCWHSPCAWGARGGARGARREILMMVTCATHSAVRFSESAVSTVGDPEAASAVALSTASMACRSRPGERRHGGESSPASAVALAAEVLGGHLPSTSPRPPVVTIDSGDRERPLTFGYSPGYTV